MNILVSDSLVNLGRNTINLLSFKILVQRSGFLNRLNPWLFLSMQSDALNASKLLKKNSRLFNYLYHCIQIPSNMYNTINVEKQ